MLKLNHLTKKFLSKTVLNDVSYTFDNRVYGLLGANGAGKTTMLRCITGLYKTKPDMVSALDKSSIGYLPQKFGMFKDLTVREMMRYFANLKGMKTDVEQSISEVIELVNLSDRIDSRIRKLSGGMIRRVGIAQALLGNPQVIIFDEPTAGLDPEERLRFKSIISKIKGNKTIIISTHIVEDVEAVCDDIVVINNGVILKSGSCSEISAIAAGKVYELSEEQKASLPETALVEKQFSKGDQIYYRVLSAQELPFLQSEPTIEDGYIFTIKGL